MYPMQHSTLNDSDIIFLYLNGDESAFEELLNRHKDKIYTSIYLFVRDSHLADDIFQDTFIKIIDTLKSGKYNEEGRFIQWAMRIAYNLCVDYFRRMKKMPNLAPSDDFNIFDIIHAPEDNAEQRIIRNQTSSRVRTLIDSLPPEQREVVVLRHYADLSFKEIAELTRVSINTALGRMRYALINIRKMMAERELPMS